MKKGITLVEVIVTLVIIAIVAALAVPSVFRYRRYAEMKSRDRIARSIFVAASNSLSQKTIGGVLNDISYVGKVQLDSLITDKGDYYKDEITYNEDNIAYLSKGKDSDVDNELYKLIEPYISDETVLKNAILIEYNVVTGKVLSVFYSDRVDSFGYGYGSFVDIGNRTSEARKTNKVGYYGVSTTGVPNTPDERE